MQRWVSSLKFVYEISSLRSRRNSQPQSSIIYTEKFDSASFGFPDFDDFDTEMLDMDTFVNMFSGAMTTPGAVPESDLPEMIASTTKTFTSLANTLGKPVPN